MKIDLNHILTLEDIELQEVDSIKEYIRELGWFQVLINRHINRCKIWEEDILHRPSYGKLHEFLKQFKGDDQDE